MNEKQSSINTLLFSRLAVCLSHTMMYNDERTINSDEKRLRLLLLLSASGGLSKNSARRQSE